MYNQRTKRFAQNAFISSTFNTTHSSLSHSASSPTSRFPRHTLLNNFALLPSQPQRATSLPQTSPFQHPPQFPPHNGSTSTHHATNALSHRSQPLSLIGNNSTSQLALNSTDSTASQSIPLSHQSPSSLHPLYFLPFTPKPSQQMELRTTAARLLSTATPSLTPRLQLASALRSTLQTHQRAVFFKNQSMISMTRSDSTKSSQLHPTMIPKRGLFGVVQNIRHMDFNRCLDNYQHPFVWLEEYKLGRYRADKKRVLFHARRTGGIQPPFDPIRGEYMDEWEYLHLLGQEREERFRRLNMWRKANIVRRFLIHTILKVIISFYNWIQDRVTRFIGWTTLKPRGVRIKEKRYLRYFFFLGIRYPMQILLRVLASFFLRLELTRIWSLRDLDFHMQNRVSGELYAKYRWPTKYSLSKYLIALYEPMFNTFNYFHGARLVVLNVIWPLIQRWWHHINNYKPYLGFMKFGVLQLILVTVTGTWVGMEATYQWLDHATYSYKANFAHTYIALMTRAIYADVLISLIEDGLIQVDNLTEGHDFEMHTKMKSEEYKYIDDEVRRRCEVDPEYREQLRLEGIPVTLDEFYGIEGIPTDLSPKEQVLFILKHYNDYTGITKQMLRELRPLREFVDKYIRILYSLGLVDEFSWANAIMGNISSPRTFLYAYRALLNVIGTRDGDTDDPSVQHHAMIRALTRKFDLSILPPHADHVRNMVKLNRPYCLQFQQTPWDKWAMMYDMKQVESAKHFVNDRPSMNLDVYHGADKSSYDPIKHGEHQFFNNLPSVTNGYNMKGNHDGIGGFSDINLKGVGNAFFAPYVAILLPAYHCRPLDHEMVVLQQIKEDLISIARIHPEFKNEIPLEYDPYQYKHHIQPYLRVFGSNKLATWEKMLGRDFFFETPDLMLPSHDIPAQKHAKWLWATVLSCVTEKIENHWFVSPMYYIEGTCPDLGETPFRSKVDTISRYLYRNEIGRPITQHQTRGIDYQMIDPFAEENVMLMKQFKFDRNTWDFKNMHILDPRTDEMYKTAGEDLGYWPGAKSSLPFLGVNKYRGSNPLTGYIGMLVTSAENLMTVNRTARDVMFRTGTDEKYKQPVYDPFGPQYRHSDGEYRNYPEEGPHAYLLARDPDGRPSVIESDPAVQAQWSDKSIIPSFELQHATQLFYKGTQPSPSEASITRQLGSQGFRDIAESIATRDPSPQSNILYPTPTSSTDKQQPQGLQSLPESLLAISRQQRAANTNIYELRENEQELLYRLQDYAGDGQLYYDNKRNLNKIQHGRDYNPQAQLDTILAQSGSIANSRHYFDSARIPPEYFDHDMKPIVDKYNKALELHHQDPFHHPYPLPPRQPHEQTAYKSNSRDDSERF